MMKVCISQWIGKREKQEDSYAVRYLPEGVLFLVCDGMGGHQCGEIASRVAADAFAEHFVSGEGDTPTRLRAALDAANESVRLAFCANGVYGGTTLTAAYVSGGVLWWVSVGDSPLLVWRNKHLLRLNADHSLRSEYMEYVKQGVMTYESAAALGHFLSSALTGGEMKLVDAPSTPFPLLPGDRLVLASDGADDILLPFVAPPSLGELFCEGGEPPLATRVVQACIALGDARADNTTVLTLDWSS